ncbi:MAG: RNA polymerase sigma factor [Ignavibacteriaceae bacterium]|jgi:RNA polymerase sigma-70 factor (ECF subfamily)|nr:RNA polymerase sigma factor [Ignavibacteriaceae bacterium]MCC6637849.1 RNA polymerase sigma factor [Ignavibacteriaceae bacterium]
MNEKEINDGMQQAQNIFNLKDDFSLIRAFNEGEETAFNDLVNRHKEKVRNLIYLNLGSTSSIDDISQEVFLAVYRKLKQFRFQSQFTTWLYTITINKIRDHIRKQKIMSVFSAFSSDDTENIVEPGSFKENFDVNEMVRDAVAKLPRKLKEPLILRDFEGMSYQEISDATGIETGTVKSRIFRARESLKKMLEPWREELL